MRTIFVDLSLIFIMTSLFSCNNPKEEIVVTHVKTVLENKNPELFKSKVIVLLSKELNKKSNILDLQDFIENGKSFIPVFTSMEKYMESTKGVDLGKSQIEIDGMFLLSILKGNEILKINPSLNDEEFYRASELLVTYKSEIDSVKLKLSNN